LLKPGSCISRLALSSFVMKPGQCRRIQNGGIHHIRMERGTLTRILNGMSAAPLALAGYGETEFNKSKKYYRLNFRPP